MKFTERIKQAALLIGFHKIGISPAAPLKEFSFFEYWLSRGYHGKMEWMSSTRESRRDPSRLLPGARSVISVALNYYTDFSHSEDKRHGKISRYAWGRDYHTIMKKMLRKLLNFIKMECKEMGEYSPSNLIIGKIAVDSSPVMEKVLAERAGIGWIGKNSNLITKDFGSWVFLGEIMLNAELEYDTPSRNFCGKCRRCIEACPTGAIVEEGVINSNLCISYLTIEHRGEFPAEITGIPERWIFGCDICQDICPWNRFSKPTDVEEFFPSSQTLLPELDKISTISRDQFMLMFKDTPVMRTGWEGLVRNSLAAGKLS
ncbi:MAG: tRNA epoxyqueuosine(34) reductase QueG [Fidelibacterota bacterium]